MIEPVASARNATMAILILNAVTLSRSAARACAV